MTPWARGGRRLLRDAAAWSSAVVFLAVVVLALLAPRIAPYDPNATVGGVLEFPSRAHPLGTDELGRDMWSRLLHGGRYSLLIGSASVSAGMVVGTLLGLLAGHFPRPGNVIMRCVDVMLAFPGLLFAIVVVATLGPGLSSVIIAVAVSRVPVFARLTRSLVMGVAARDYVEAAHALGAGTLRVMGRHVLPHVLPSVLVYATLNFGSSILLGAMLKFLGLGVQPPTAEWGAMAAAARFFIREGPHASTFPSLAIFITVLSLNLLSDGLRDALDPKTQTRGAS